MTALPNQICSMPKRHHLGRYKPQNNREPMPKPLQHLRGHQSSCPIPALQMTCESRSSASVKFRLANSISALFLKASASKQVFGSWPPAPANRVAMTSAARAAVPQWPTMRPSGRTTRLGPPPHRPKHPQDFTATFGGARPDRVSRV